MKSPTDVVAFHLNESSNGLLPQVQRADLSHLPRRPSGRNQAPSPLPPTRTSPMDTARHFLRCPIVAEECDDPGCPGPRGCVLKDPVKLAEWKARRERIVISDFSEIEGRVMAHILAHPVEEFVTTEYAKEVCKIGQGADCCRYLTMSPKGWSCEKNGSLREVIDARTDMVAKADNCGGRKSL